MIIRLLIDFFEGCFASVLEYSWGRFKMVRGPVLARAIAWIKACIAHEKHSLYFLRDKK